MLKDFDMQRQAMPWLTLKNKQSIDLFFECLDPGSQRKLFQDLKDGHTIKVPSFGGRITNIAKTLRWDELDSIEQQKIENLLSTKPRHTDFSYDAQSHSYKQKKARSVVSAFLKLARSDQDKKASNFLNKKASNKPSIFKQTIYRLPTKDELKEIDSYNLSANQIYEGFCYTIIGRGIEREPQKRMIIESIQMLVNLFPHNIFYKEALKKAEVELYSSKEATRDYSCITAPLPQDIAEEIRSWGLKNIPDEDLINDGREPDVHVTVLYGLHGNDPYEIRPIIDGYGPIKLTLGEFSIFENDGQDVLKISVKSHDLLKLNKLIASNFEYTKTHPEYIPHCTLAYLKPGLGKKYVGCKIFAGKNIKINEIIFSGNDDRKTVFPISQGEQ